MSIEAKIRKLLELSKSPNEHEALAAAERAAQLMAEHHLSVLDLAQEVERIDLEEGRVDATDESPDARRVEAWEKTLFSSVCSVSGARGYLSGYGRRWRMQVLGARGVVATVAYVYQWLRSQVGRMARAETRDRGESNSWRRSYSLGVVTRVHERMTAAKARVVEGASQALARVDDDLKKAIADQLSAKSLKPVRIQDPRADAAGVGYRDGDRVELPSDDARRLGSPSKRLT